MSISAAETCLAGVCYATTSNGGGSTTSVLVDHYYQSFLPWLESTAVRLDLPSWSIYTEAWRVCIGDLLRASQSSSTLLVLTWKPIIILVWIILGRLWKFIMVHGGSSLQTIAIHLKRACLQFVKFQMSLNSTQLLGEAVLIALCVGLYYLRQWLQRQTYWRRFVKYLQQEKQKLVQKYTETMEQIATVSKLLAMALPHLFFVICCILVTWSKPSRQLLQWMTYETPLLNGLTVWYPFVSTLWWVHSQRNGDETTNTKDKTKNGQGSGTTAARVRATARATTKYWLSYWQLYALVQAVATCVSMVPIVGRFLKDHPLIGFVSGECKLFFFVWVFGMERIMGSSASASSGTATTATKTKNAKNGSNTSILAEAFPLTLFQTFVTPLVLQFHAIVSETIPKETWQKWIVSKTQLFLSAAVLIRAISEQTKDWLVHITKEARVLAVPAITLFMPGFVTQFGVAYARFLVPVAKSAQTTKPKSKYSNNDHEQLVYLQYWIVHCGCAWLLTQMEGVLWWIPFSTHALFLVWSYLSLPKAIEFCYAILESELVAFGILPSTHTNNKDATKKPNISETRTARLVRGLINRLPSANNNNNNGNSGGETETSNPSSKETSKKEPVPVHSGSSVISGTYDDTIITTVDPIPEGTTSGIKTETASSRTQ